MNQINLNDLVEITEKKIRLEELKKEIELTKNEIQREEEKYQSLEIKERGIVLDNLKQKMDLEFLQNQILKLPKGNKTKQNTLEIIKKAIENFFLEKDFGEFIENLIKDLKTQDSDLAITVGKNAEKYLLDQTFVKDLNPDFFRISTQNPAKTYILDLDVLSSKLEEKLLQKKLNLTDA